jgi:hypothetical protein
MHGGGVFAPPPSLFQAFLVIIVLALATFVGCVILIGVRRRRSQKRLDELQLVAVARKQQTQADQG